MLMLSALRSLLTQVLSTPHLHTAVLLTLSGELVSFASEPARAKDDIRIIVGLCGELWHETREQGYGMVDSELGRIVVLPVECDEECEEDFSEEYQPVMLIALNATDAVGWEDLYSKGAALAAHIAKPLSKFHELKTVIQSSPGPTTATSPAPARI